MRKDNQEYLLNESECGHELAIQNAGPKCLGLQKFKAFMSLYWKVFIKSIVLIDEDGIWSLEENDAWVHYWRDI